jgi:hypothetical protein
MVTAHIPLLHGGWDAAAGPAALRRKRGAAFILGIAALLLPGGLPVAALIYLYRNRRTHAADRRRLGAKARA